MNQDNDIKSMVAFSLEVVLMRIGGPEYQRFIVHLERDHNMEIHDCFDNPQALKTTIQEVYGKAYPSIIENLEVELEEVASRPEVVEFFKILHR